MAGVRVSSTVPATGLHRLADVLSPLVGIVHADCVQRAAENVLGRVYVRVPSCPHLRQWNTAWLSRFSLSQYPQALQMRDVS